MDLCTGPSLTGSSLFLLCWGLVPTLQKSVQTHLKGLMCAQGKWIMESVLSLLRVQTHSKHFIIFFSTTMDCEEGAVSVLQ